MSTPDTFDITLPARVWLEAARAVAALDELDEMLGDAVWFSAAGSRCAFLLEQDGVVVMVFAHDWHGPDAQVPLSPRVIRVAASAARSGASITARVVDGTTAVVHTGAVQVAVDLVTTDRIPDLPRVPDVAVAVTVDAASLRDGVATVRAAPIGDLGPAPLPPTWIGVEPGRLSLHVDWGEHGAGRTTARLGARADAPSDGPIAARRGRPAGSATDTVAVDSTVLGALLRGLDVDEHREVEVALPDRLDSYVRVWAGAWCAWLPCVDATVGRLLPQLVERLADAGLPYDVVGPRAVRFGTPDRRVLGELHGGLSTGPSEVLRLSVVLAADVEPSFEVLHEINAANAGLVGIRVWLDGDRVVSGLDLPAEHLDDLIVSVGQLLGQVDGLGPFLGALSPASGPATTRVPIPVAPPS